MTFISPADISRGRRFAARFPSADTSAAVPTRMSLDSSLHEACRGRSEKTGRSTPFPTLSRSVKRKVTETRAALYRGAHGCRRRVVAGSPDPCRLLLFAQKSPTVSNYPHAGPPFAWNLPGTACLRGLPTGRRPHLSFGVK